MGARSRPASILIVEDDVDCLDALASVVAAEGYDVITAGDAKSALQLLRMPIQPGLLLLDLHMPGVMSGFELLDEKARSLELSSIPTVLVSGAEVDDAVRAYGAAGVVASLKKPLEPESVLGAIERYGPACCRDGGAVLDMTASSDGAGDDDDGDDDGGDDAADDDDPGGAEHSGDEHGGNDEHGGDDARGANDERGSEARAGAAAADEGDGRGGDARAADARAADARAADDARDVVSHGGVSGDERDEADEGDEGDEDGAGDWAQETTESKRVRSAMNARQRLLAIVAHDMRTPLSSITLTACELERSGAPSEVTAAARSIAKNARRLERLVRDLLDFSSINNGRLNVQLARDAIADVVQSAVEAHRIVATPRRLLLDVDDDAAGAVVVCDRERVEQILANLVGNAVKFTPPHGSVSVHVGRNARDIIISVADTGTGIEPDDLPLIFEEFWQGRSHTTAQSGVGLGLHITRALVEAHHGNIWVESEPGVGTRFTFSLPIATESQLPTSSSASSASAASSTTSATSDTRSTAPSLR